MGAKREVYALFFNGNFSYFCPNQDPNPSLVCFLEIHQIKMVVTWHECEHEEEDMITLHDLGMVTPLWNGGLLKFFCISNMRQQINLLQYFLDAWDPTNKVFQIRGKSIPLIVEDIYFLTSLSGHGVPLLLLGSVHGGESMRDYIRWSYRDGSQPSRDRNISIRYVNN